MPNSYPLLEKAPPHLSPEFIDYLREHNVVVAEDDEWLMIENCKYHTPEQRHYTAFSKCAKINFEGIPWHLYPAGWQVLVKRKKDRTVQRWHVHFIE